MSNTIYNKITINNDTLIDLSQDTVTSAAHIVSGHVGHLADGTQVTGTASDDFIITVSYNSTTEMYEPNKTFAEVQAAYNNGKNIIVTSDEIICKGEYENQDQALYIDILAPDNNVTYVISSVLNSQGYYEAYRIPSIDTSSANATENDILSSRMAYGANGPIYGVIPRRTSSNVNVSGQTVTITNGYYASDTSVNVASGTEGTPTATKGTVSNHSVSVTPSVTNTAGYISGGTKTGTVVSVSASELVSGNKEITSNGSNIDVTDYATVTVNVPTGGGSSINYQTVKDGDRVGTTSYTAVPGQSITVAVSGKYTVSWTGFRSSTGGTNGSQLYIDGTAQGNANTTFSNHIQINELTNITLNKDQVVTVRARARASGNYMYVSNLTIEQTA